MKRFFALLVPCGLLAGCATTPPVASIYYFPRAQSEITITQTLGCSVSNQVVSSAVVVPTNGYQPDYSVEHRAAFKAFDGRIRDSDTGVTTTDDGRLAGINATGTGQGAAFLKNAVALAGVFTGVAAPVAAGGSVKGMSMLNDQIVAGKATVPADAFCGLVRDNSASKPTDKVATVTLTYHAKIEYLGRTDGVILLRNDKSYYGADPSGQFVAATAGGVTLDAAGKPTPATLVIEPDRASADLYDKLMQAKRYTWQFSLALEQRRDAPKQPEYAKPPALGYAEGSGNIVALPHLYTLSLAIRGPAGTLDKPKGAAPETSLWASDFVVPTQEIVWLPVTKAPLFGAAKTILGVTPSGLVNKLEYSKTSASGDLSAFAPALAMQAEGRTDTQVAAALQAQADIIYQQKRLVGCQLDPNDCQGK